MLARTLVASAAQAALLPRAACRRPLLRLPLPLLARHARCWYADRVVKVPPMAESISEGTLKQWTKKVGDRVEQDEEVATIETDKIDVAVNAPEAGTIKELLVNEEDTVHVGQDLAVLEPGAAPSAEADPQSASHSGQTASQPESDGPEQRRDSAAETPADESAGSQPAETHDQSKPPEPAPQSSHVARARDSTAPSNSSSSGDRDSASQGIQSSASQTESAFSSRDERRVKMNRMRLRIAERLKQSQNTAASLTTFNEVDMSSLMEFRKLYKDNVLKKTGVKLGFMSAFARACVLAMRDLPVVNASVEGPGGGDTVVYRDYVDVSVAVATEKGLVTPVVRNIETMDMITIEKSIADMGKKARDGKLTIEDMAGGTFTISNGGVFGSMMGTPIINLPQSAVLGLHAIKDRPVAVAGKVEIRPMMYLALTYDHRLLDGREAVQFLVKVKDYIEDPRRMLL